MLELEGRRDVNRCTYYWGILVSLLCGALELSFHWLHQCRGGSNMGTLAFVGGESSVRILGGGEKKNFIKVKCGISCLEFLMPSHVNAALWGWMLSGSVRREVWSGVMSGGSGLRLGLSCDQTELAIWALVSIGRKWSWAGSNGDPTPQSATPSERPRWLLGSVPT